MRAKIKLFLRDLVLVRKDAVGNDGHAVIWPEKAQRGGIFIGNGQHTIHLLAGCPFKMRNAAGLNPGIERGRPAPWLAAIHLENDLLQPVFRVVRIVAQLRAGLVLLYNGQIPGHLQPFKLDKIEAVVLENFCQAVCELLAVQPPRQVWLGRREQVPQALAGRARRGRDNFYLGTKFIQRGGM